MPARIIRLDDVLIVTNRQTVGIHASTIEKTTMPYFNSRHSVGAIIAIAVGALGSPAAAVAAPAEAFNYARVDIFYDGLPNPPADSFTDAYSTNSTAFAEQGDSSAAASYGKARADFGSIGFAALSGAAGLAVSADGFVVTGGSGSGSLQVSFTFDGSLVGHAADMSYTLFSSAKPFDVDAILAGLSGDDQKPKVIGATDVLHAEVVKGEGALKLTLTGSIPFTYGQTVYLANVFGGDVAIGCAGEPSLSCGSENFYHPAIFGISASTGAVLSSVSQTRYAPAVPEPETYALLIAGLGVTGWAARRKSR